MRQRYILGFVIFLAVILAPDGFAGKTELTTYYPSPYGEYNTLKLAPQASEPAACSAANRGLLYYHYNDSGGAIQNSLMSCDGAQWIPFAAAPINNDISLGGYSWSSYTLNSGAGSAGWLYLRGASWVINPGDRAAVCPNCVATKYGDLAFRVNLRLLPAGTYNFVLHADVDVDQVSGAKDVTVQMRVQRYGSTVLLYSDMITDDNDPDTGHVTNATLPAAGTGHFPAGRDCVVADRCTTVPIDMSGSAYYPATGNYDSFYYYAFLFYRTNNTIALRLRNVSVTVVRVAD